MKRFEIAPALEPDEWKHRRCGAVSIDHVNGETHVVVTDPDGELVRVSGPDEVFALMVLANDALPEGHLRKITRQHLLALWSGDAEIVRHIADVFDKLSRPHSAFLAAAAGDLRVNLGDLLSYGR